ncbi:hypothetical protein AB0J80_19340 [Actinoplanes sp. NPDC049548]|uniref:hypothetical protein n=1 Tax=Actinoplanes sp. NPDC049548 TaxID=3155152 RepID=UPI0034291A62
MTVIHADASDLASYRGAVPADLVIMAGVLSNISDADARDHPRASSSLRRRCLGHLDQDAAGA